MTRTLRYTLSLLIAISLLWSAHPRAATGTLMPSPFQTVLDTAGNPISGAKICTYLAGTTTATATYTDAALSVANTNPIVADSAGRFTAYLSLGTSYKFVYQDATGTAGVCNGVTLKTVDNVFAVPSSASNVDIAGTAGEALTAGQVVYLSDGSGGKTAGQWYKADSANTYSSTLPEIGMAQASMAAAASGTMRLVGSVTGLSSLTVGSTYYVGTAGAVTATAPTNARALGVADTTASLVLKDVPSSAIADNGINDFRITLTTGTPVTTADVTAATTLYATPKTGNRIALFASGGVATVYTSAEFSIAVPATTSQMYDVFAFSNSGTPTLELLAWTNDTTRATALTLATTGVYTKSGDLTRRYLGSFRTTTVSGQTEDSFAKRYVWNYYNRVARLMRVKETTDTWAYNGVFRQANGAAANQLDFVIGVTEVPVEGYVVANVSGNGTGFPSYVAIGEDSTTTADSGSLNQATYTFNAGVPTPISAQLKKYPAVGRHTWVWLEKGGAATITWYGDNASDGTQSGIHGVIQG